MTKGMHQLKVALSKLNITYILLFQQQFKSKHTIILNILPKRSLLADFFLLSLSFFFFVLPRAFQG